MRCLRCKNKLPVERLVQNHPFCESCTKIVIDAVEPMELIGAMNRAEKRKTEEEP